MASSLSTPGLDTVGLADALAIDRSVSALVTIDLEQVAQMAAHIRRHVDVAGYARARWDDSLFWNVEDPPAQRSQYFAVGCCVNFRFWELRDGAFVAAAGELDGVRHRGAMYMWACLRRALDGGIVDILDAPTLAAFTDEQFDAIFTDDRGVNPLAVAREERIANLRDLGAGLCDHWGGAFFNMVAASEGSLATFARESRDLRAFDDPLYKLTMVNAILHLGSEVYAFRDEPLPAIDYHLLRHALRQGMLRPIPRLLRKLTRRELLEPDEAYELRRTALSAFLDLAALTGMSGELLDNRYWLNRVNCADIPVCVDPSTASACPFLDACERVVSIALPLEYTRYY